MKRIILIALAYICINCMALKATITIGSSMSLERGIASIGKGLQRGMHTCVAHQNKIGGIQGQDIALTIYNDNYTPFLARENIQRLLETTDIIACPLGSITLQAYLPLIQQQDASLFFPVTGSSAFRNKELKQLINYRPSFADETDILIEHLIERYGSERFLFFYQDDAYGRSGLDAAHQLLTRHGITQWIDVPYVLGQTDFTDAVKKIRSAQVDAIGFFSTTPATQELIRQLGVDALSNKKLFGLSFLGEVPFRIFLKQKGLHVLFGAAVPNPKESPLAIAQEYRTAMDAAGLGYDVFSFEAYITTSLLLDTMLQIKAPITGQTIMQQLESLYRATFKGLRLTFNPETRSLARYVWIETGEHDTWIEKKLTHILA